MGALLGIWRFLLLFRASGGLPPLESSGAGKLDRQVDPVVDELAESTIVVQLFLSFGHILLADKPARALSMAGKTELMVRTVLDRGRGLAATTGTAADIVLFGERPGMQVAQCSDLLFDFFDPLFERGLLRHRHHSVALRCQYPADDIVRDLR